MGGGAVAVADPGVGGSAPNGEDDGTNKPIGGGPTAGSPVGNITNTVRETTQGITGRPGGGAQPGRRPSTGATSTLGSGRQPGQQPSTGAIRPKAGGTDEDRRKTRASSPRIPIRSPRFRTSWRRFLMGDGAGYECRGARYRSGGGARYRSGGAGYQRARAGTRHAHLGCRCGRPAQAAAVRPFPLHVGHRRGGACRGRIGRHRRYCAVGGLGCVSGAPIAAGPAGRRYLGRGGGRQRNQGCNARCDCAQSSVGAIRDAHRERPMAPV